MEHAADGASESARPDGVVRTNADHDIDRNRDRALVAISVETPIDAAEELSWSASALFVVEIKTLPPPEASAPVVAEVVVVPGAGVLVETRIKRPDIVCAGNRGRDARCTRDWSCR